MLLSDSEGDENSSDFDFGNIVVSFSINEKDGVYKMEKNLTQEYKKSLV